MDKRDGGGSCDLSDAAHPAQNRSDLALFLSLSVSFPLLWYNFNDDSRLGLRPANPFDDARSPTLPSVRINESKPRKSARARARARQRDIYLTATRGKVPPNPL